MATNSNYSTLVGGFAAGESNAVYTAPDGAEFNAAGAFGASAMFMIDASIQEVAANTAPDEQTIWGNMDVANETGWRIALTLADDDQLQLVGELGDGNDIVTLAMLLSNDEGPAFVERLLQVGLWFDGTRAALSVNGSIVTQAAAAYAASQYSPTLGARQTGADAYTEPATYVKVAGCAFSPVTVPGSRSLGSFAGLSFSSCRGGYNMGYLAAIEGADWVHRYDLATSCSGISGSITKSAAGVITSGLAAAPATLADLGNRGPTKIDSGATAAPLTKNGALTLGQVENPDWYHGVGYIFLPPQ